MALTGSLGGVADPLLLADYAEVLGLTGAQVVVLTDFLEAWDKLRVCCGAQMSKDYRGRLTGLEWKKDASPKLDMVARQPKASDMCESYDMDKIEQKLMSTEVFQQCGDNVELIRQLSSADAPLDGTCVF